MSQFDLFAPPPPSSPESTARRRLQSGASTHDLFFALRPAPADTQRLAAHATREGARLGVGGEPTDPGRLHVSLYAMVRYERGDPFPQADVERWMSAASIVSSRVFEVVFDGVATFGGRTNPLVLKSSTGEGVAGVRALHRELGIALANAGETVKDRSFEPHMTVSYGGMRIAEASIAPIAWMPDELVLIDSHVGQHVHEVLGRWPLPR